LAGSSLRGRFSESEELEEEFPWRLLEPFFRSEPFSFSGSTMWELSMCLQRREHT
jgi:hypothetical protein